MPQRTGDQLAQGRRLNRIHKVQNRTFLHGLRRLRHFGTLRFAEVACQRQRFGNGETQRLQGTRPRLRARVGRPTEHPAAGVSAQAGRYETDLQGGGLGRPMGPTGAPPVARPTPPRRMMIQMLGAFAEFEREMVRERTRSGLAAARAQASTTGRPMKLTALGLAGIGHLSCSS